MIVPFIHVLDDTRASCARVLWPTGHAGPSGPPSHSNQEQRHQRWPTFGRAGIVARRRRRCIGQGCAEQPGAEN
jgi:hypothetical protein